MTAKRIAQFGLLTAAALVLGWVERMIPIAPGVPGIKLGLGNTVLLYAIYMMGAGEATLLMVIKVLLSGFMFSSLSGIMYSFAGGILSLAVMLLIKRIPYANIIVVSVAGAVAHNMGQIIVASVFVLSRAVLGYIPVLLVSGVITGLLTGIVAKYVLKGLKLYREKPRSAPKKTDQDKE